MAKLSELVSHCSTLLQPSLFSDFCTNGLQVEGKKEIHSLAAAVTASLSVIERAAELKVDCLLVHHGLFWQKDPYDIVGVIYRKLKILLDAEISLLAYHLPLDAHRTLGNNWLAAQQMGWQGLEPFPSNDRQPIGVKGRFPKISSASFGEQLATFYGNRVDSVLGGKEFVETAALVSGGAHKWIKEAIAEGVDCYVTGTRDEPLWHQAHEGGINFFAVGHAASEVVGPQALGRHLADHFALDFSFLMESNPF